MPLLGTFAKAFNTFSNTNLTVSVHYSTISNSQQLETRWICGQNGACLFCLTIKVVDTNNNMDAS